MSAISKIENILRVALTLLMMGVMVACTTGEGLDEAMPQPSSGKLRLSTGSSVTRGDDHYDDDPYGEQNGTLQEEKIDRVDLFFFSDADSDEASFFTYEVKNVGEITTADLSVRIPIEMTGKFTDGTAYVYALVNLPSDITVSESSNSIGGQPATLETLTSLWVHDSGFVSKDIPSSFVMRGSSEVTITGDGKNAEVYGDIRLERLASKIRLWAEIPAELYFDAEGRSVYRLEGESETDWEARKAREAVETWESIPAQSNGESNVMLYIYNITTKGRIDGYLGSEGNRPDLGYDNVDRRDEVQNAVRRLSKDVQLTEPVEDKYKKYNYTHAVPYYSYPNEWDSTTPVEEHQTYVIISMPWRRKDNGGTGELYQTCYYQVPVNALKSGNVEGDRLDPNRYYRIKIHIGMLGSKDLGSPTEIDASWEAVDWVTESVDVTIKDRRYLVVNQKEWTMNNVHTLEIPFSTSHDVEVEACYVTYFRYDDTAWGTDRDAYEGPRQTNPHNKREFNEWLNAANKTAGVGLNGEGLITASFDNKTNDVLYYKKKYFYDQIYYDKNEDVGTERHPYRGFRYYIGHEHPKTIKTEIKGYPKTITGDEKDAWDLYKTKYDQLDSVYMCTIDADKNVINFVHPLVQWKEVRNSSGELQYYVPEKHPRLKDMLWSEFSRCEIVIKIKHADWKNNDNLYRETIYITQYPAMYVEVSHDYGARYDTSSNRRGNQYVLVNANTTHAYGVSSTYWYEVTGWVTYFGSVNNNPNMYVIHTTQFSEDNELLYDLGDPRELFYNNILDNNSFVEYKNKNTADENNTPLRWSNANLTEDLPDVLLASTSGTNNVTNSQGPAWFLSRKYTATPNIPPFSRQTSTDYTYSDYEEVLSLYPEQKPDNTGSNSSSSASISWIGIIPSVKHIEWNYVNHKNNLCYYYPTDESTGAGSKENFIAPSFRIASSLGKVTLSYTTNKNSPDYNNKSKSEARRRCAVYQEAGRPAGRWRVPTMAEIKYLVQLSTDGIIPKLFGNYAGATNRYAPYWSASGLLGVRIDDNDVKEMEESEIENGEEAPAVRCVYDEWYWNKVDAENGFTPDPLDTDFKWGDLPKDNTQVQSTIQALINPKAIIANE